MSLNNLEESDLVNQMDAYTPHAENNENPVYLKQGQWAALSYCVHLTALWA